jgi:hypothetical protein
MKQTIMKNIHIIPTDKPSRLVQRRITKEIKTSSLDNPQLWNNVNIYITSEQEIKEGDYVINNLDKLIGKSIRELNSAEIKDREYSKIILTTDQDLIKDGVQPIDNEFLEWFVKNPSCKWVEVKPILSNNGRAFYGYKIIIPQEEPKQETLEEAIERLIELNRQDSFYEGAKWQAKRMYNDAECYRFLHDLMTDIKLQGLIITDDIDLKKWFEQHKKK